MSRSSDVGKLGLTNNKLGEKRGRTALEKSRYATGSSAPKSRKKTVCGNTSRTWANKSMNKSRVLARSLHLNNRTLAKKLNAVMVELSNVEEAAAALRDDNEQLRQGTRFKDEAIEDLNAMIGQIAHLVVSAGKRAQDALAWPQLEPRSDTFTLEPSVILEEEKPPNLSIQEPQNPFQKRDRIPRTPVKDNVEDSTCAAQPASFYLHPKSSCSKISENELAPEATTSSSSASSSLPTVDDHSKSSASSEPAAITTATEQPAAISPIAQAPPKTKGTVTKRKERGTFTKPPAVVVVKPAEPTGDKALAVYDFSMSETMNQTNCPVPTLADLRAGTDQKVTAPSTSAESVSKKAADSSKKRKISKAAVGKEKTQAHKGAKLAKKEPKCSESADKMEVQVVSESGEMVGECGTATLDHEEMANAKKIVLKKKKRIEGEDLSEAPKLKKMKKESEKEKDSEEVFDLEDDEDFQDLHPRRPSAEMKEKKKKKTTKGKKKIDEEDEEEEKKIVEEEAEKHSVAKPDRKVNKKVKKVVEGEKENEKNAMENKDEEKKEEKHKKNDKKVEKIDVDEEEKEVAKPIKRNETPKKKKNEEEEEEEEKAINPDTKGNEAEVEENEVKITAEEDQEKNAMTEKENQKKTITDHEEAAEEKKTTKGKVGRKPTKKRTRKAKKVEEEEEEGLEEIAKEPVLEMAEELHRRLAGEEERMDKKSTADPKRMEASERKNMKPLSRKARKEEKEEEEREKENPAVVMIGRDVRIRNLMPSYEEQEEKKKFKRLVTFDESDDSLVVLDSVEKKRKETDILLETPKSEFLKPDDKRPLGNCDMLNSEQSSCSRPRRAKAINLREPSSRGKLRRGDAEWCRPNV